MADIFLSYAEEDRATARILAERLEERGWSVFWDRKILSGESWREVIARELASASAVVVAWSAASVGSSWVQEEGDDARRRGLLVPVLIEPVDIPIGFRSVQTTDLADGGDSAFDELCAGIDHVMNRPPGESRGDRAVTAPGSKRRSSSPVRIWAARLVGALVGAIVGFFVGGTVGQMVVGGRAEDFHYVITAGIVVGIVSGVFVVLSRERRRARKGLE